MDAYILVSKFHWYLKEDTLETVIMRSINSVLLFVMKASNHLTSKRILQYSFEGTKGKKKRTQRVRLRDIPSVVRGERKDQWID